MAKISMMDFPLLIPFLLLRKLPGDGPKINSKILITTTITNNKPKMFSFSGFRNGYWAFMYGICYSVT